MFDDTRLRGTEFDSAYIELRRQWEPVTEVTQLRRADSETHPDLSPDDEFADFETFLAYLQVNQSPYQARAGDYMRTALTRGLALEQQFGNNPYQFGVIGLDRRPHRYRQRRGGQLLGENGDGFCTGKQEPRVGGRRALTGRLGDVGSPEPGGGVG